MIENANPVRQPRRGRASCRGTNLTGTEATSGQPVRRRIRSGKDMGDGRTTRALSKEVIGRAELACRWLSEPDGAGGTKPMELTPFLQGAIDAAVRGVLASNPDFKLPPWCAFKG